MSASGGRTAMKVAGALAGAAALAALIMLAIRAFEPNPEGRLLPPAERARQAAKVKQQAEQVKLKQEKQEQKPMRLHFETAGPPSMQAPVPATLIVERNPAAWPASTPASGTLSVRLQLPPGVRLEAPGWAPAAAPAEAEEDVTGPWSWFERTEAVSGEGEALARLPLQLTVAEEGLNWVVIAQARFQAEGHPPVDGNTVLFVTLKEGVAEFHASPKKFLRPEDAPVPPPTHQHGAPPPKEQPGAETN